jgi:hypothetical protein
VTCRRRCRCRHHRTAAAAPPPRPPHRRRRTLRAHVVRVGPRVRPRRHRALPGTPRAHAAALGARRARSCRPASGGRKHSRPPRAPRTRVSNLARPGPNARAASFRQDRAGQNPAPRVREHAACIGPGVRLLGLPPSPRPWGTRGDACGPRARKAPGGPTSPPCRGMSPHAPVRPGPLPLGPIDPSLRAPPRRRTRPLPRADPLHTGGPVAARGPADGCGSAETRPTRSSESAARRALGSAGRTADSDGTL